MIIAAIIVLAATAITGFLWHSQDQHRKQVAICKTRTVGKYLDERYGNTRPGLDIKIIEEVNEEALRNCQKTTSH